MHHKPGRQNHRLLSQNGWRCICICIRHSACRCSVLGFILAFLGPSSLIPVVPHPSSLLPLLWPWPWPWHPLDWILLRAGTHHYLHDFGIRCMAFEQSLFRHHFGTFIFRILVPTWPQLGPQNHQTSTPRAIHNPSKIAFDFRSHF